MPTPINPRATPHRPPPDDPWRSSGRPHQHRHKVALTLLLLLTIGLPQLSRAQPMQTNHAGLIIRHGDGRIITACVAFDEPNISGITLLDRAGINYLAQNTNGNAAICQLDGEGCSYPADDCFCHCKGAECAYWAYQHLNGGRWNYATSGASSATVSPGHVEGWAWGTGTIQTGAQPPVLTFEQICADILPITSTHAQQTNGEPATRPQSPSTNPVQPSATSTTSTNAAPAKANYLFFSALLLLLICGIAFAILRRRAGRDT